MTEVDRNDEGYRALWSTVIYQAINDIDSHTNRRPAIDWVFSDRSDEGSMRWICDMLDLDYGKLQSLSMTREGRAKILKKDVMTMRVRREQQEEDDE
jgi:hypothetical protein